MIHLARAEPTAPARSAMESWKRRLRWPLRRAGDANLPAARGEDRGLRRDARFGQALLGTATGLLGGLPLGGELGHLVAILRFGDDGWGIGMLTGIYGGSLCGLAAGLVPLFCRRWWVRALLLTTIGAALGTYLANDQHRGAALTEMGAAAGAIHGMVMTGLLGVTRRLQMRESRNRRTTLGAEAAIPGCDARRLSAEEVCTLVRLRQRIRGAGRGVLVIRYLLPAMAGVGIMSVGMRHWLDLMPWIPVYLAVGLLLGLPLSIPLACVYRRLRSRSFRRQLASLPPAERLEVLAALDHPDLPGTREFVRPLLRELSIGKELAPAAVADGRGDEMTV
jgi:hypothetical protein